MTVFPPAKKSMVTSRPVETTSADSASSREMIDALKRAEALFAYHARLLESVYDAIVATDERLAVTAWNPAAEKIYGWKADEVLGRDVREVVRSELDPGRRDEVLRAVAETGYHRVETVHHRKDGTPIHIEESVIALRNAAGQVTKYVTTHRDITERKRTEEALRHAHAELEQRVVERTGQLSAVNAELVKEIAERKVAEEALRNAHERAQLVLESITDNFFALSKDWRFTYLNKHAAAQMKQLGKDPAALIGTVLWDEFPVVPNEAAIRRVMSERVAVSDELFYAPLGEWVENHMYPSNDGGLITFQKYISDRKRAEEAAAKSQTELARVARVMTMGEITASIAHEINQPLAAVVTNGNACLRWLAGATPNLDEAREAAQRIIRDGNRAGDIIQRIRTLMSKTIARKESVNLNETIQDVAVLVPGELRRNRVSLKLELSEDLPPVLGDRVQMQQVLLNLMMNAIEAMSAVAGGQRELIIQTQNAAAGHLRVTVRDSGPGLENIQRIFEPFYTTKWHGMGMGLSIGRSIVEAHGGRLWATPNDGPGATFHFTLPVDRVSAG
jgi:PAS domain S-box-containing protein